MVPRGALAVQSATTSALIIAVALGLKAIIKVINNIAFQNTNNDVRVSGDKFYGWREGRNCSN